MIRLKTLLCAEGVSVDRNSNNVTLFNILEQINPLRLPLALPKMVIYSLFEREDGDDAVWPADICIYLDDVELVSSPIDYKFQDLPRVRNIFTVGGLPITQPGTLKISVHPRGDHTTELGTYTVVISLPAATVQTEANPS